MNGLCIGHLIAYCLMGSENICFALQCVSACPTINSRIGLKVPVLNYIGHFLAQATKASECPVGHTEYLQRTLP